jgi:hypothetical protein
MTCRNEALERSEKALRKNQTLLQAVCDTTPDAIFLKDREGRGQFAIPRDIACRRQIGEGNSGEGTSDRILLQAGGKLVE